MKRFFTKKRIAFLAITCASLITLIVILIVPIGSLKSHALVYIIEWKRFVAWSHYTTINRALETPFTFYSITPPVHCILVWQTAIFTLMGILICIFIALLVVDIKKIGLFPVIHRRPTKTELLEQRVAELEQQVDELKKDE